MDSNSVNVYLSTHASDFPAQSYIVVRDKLLAMDPDQFQVASMLRYHNPVVAFLLSLFLGWLGIDRFYIGDILLGVLKLITGGGFGIWWLVDLFVIIPAARRKNLQTFLTLN